MFIARHAVRTGKIADLSQIWSRRDSRHLWSEIGRCTKIEDDGLESRVFFNRGDHFESRVLPIRRKFVPGFRPLLGL